MTRIISPAQSVADQLMEELGPLLSGERAAFAHRCHARAISMAHLHLMTLLEGHGPMPMGRVAELLGSGLPTATGLVTRMEERGLVERLRDTQDRRVVLVQLTESGIGELRDLQRARHQRLAAALQHLSHADQLSLLASMRSLRTAFARLTPEGEPIS